MKKRTGRPLKLDTPLSHDLKVRLDDKTYFTLLRYCEDFETDKASAVREFVQLALSQRGYYVGDLGGENR